MKVPARWRTRIFAVLCLLILFVVLEWAAKQSVRMVFGINEQSYRSYYIHDPKLLLVTWTDAYETHPYFGYVEPAGHGDRIGALASRGDNDYVIGLLGGSVAEIFGTYLLQNPDHLAKLSKAIPQIGSKTVRLVNLAHGGYKQPQQFFIASYFLDRIDLLINLDGFNEISAESFSPLYPMEFPVLSLKLYSRGATGAGWRILGNTLKWCYRGLNFLPRNVPGLSHSHVYFLFWQGFHRLFYDAIRTIDRRYFIAVLGRDPGAATDGYSNEHKVAIWKRYTLLQSRVATASHKPAIFFLQPNQYLSGSKPLSAEERVKAINPAMAETYGRGMQLTREAAAELRQSGVQIFDLTAVFAGVHESLYVDACCHVNARGNEILLDAITPILAKQVAHPAKP